MKKALSAHVTASSRFGRSANVERDHGGSAINGYMPTSRALDVISRIASGLSNPASGRTFTITGPHGGGKSSLAVFLDGLLASSASSEFKLAHEILRDIDPAVDDRLREGIKAVKGSKSGFIRAYATARNEPMTVTIGRALLGGAERQFGATQDLVPRAFASSKRGPLPTDICATVRELTKRQPVLLVIDEFGKNLEYFASSKGDGDPFLLQELAEMTQGEEAAPLVIITLQHLSFDEYVQTSSTARRREWSKIQGRFQDIPYVETPAQSRRLIASALQQSDALARAARQWVSDHRDSFDAIGLREIADDAAEAMPLHPLSLAVLPELCSRYGQNERTLFSFLAGSEPSALPAHLEKLTWDTSEQLPLVGLDVLYDYFLESSGSMIGVADGASRWIEIETRIRDAAGLSDAQLKALKTIGLLNLIASGGTIRASRPILELAFSSTSTRGVDVDELLASLVDAGLVTYRAFSDEYRIWQGSDYNLRKAVETARHAYADKELAVLLRAACDLEPLIAGRHSQKTGVLRVFSREFRDSCDASPADLDPAWDGAVYYATEPKLDPASAPHPEDGRPAVYVVPQNVTKVRHAAIEAAAITSALRDAELEGADWVARSELIERASDAHQRLQVAIGETWNTKAGWFIAGSAEPLDPSLGTSALLSDVADRAYPKTPRIANEMIARRELTSQGAKARRFLIDAMLAHRDSEAFAIEGYGPERAIYEAIFRSTGLHRECDDGTWELGRPTDRSWKPVWAAINSMLDDAVGHRVNLLEIVSTLKLPPYGLKDGIIPLLLIAALLARSDEIAVYEHGSLVLRLDDAVAERLTKNVGHFSVKNTETQRGQRAVVIDRLVARMAIAAPGTKRTPTFLNVATALFRELRLLPPFTQKTKRELSPETIAVREAFHQAAEPDVLIFDTLPQIFGLGPFNGRARLDREVADLFADRLAMSIRELRDAYPNLLKFVSEQLARATSTTGDLDEVRRSLQADATRLNGHVLERRLQAFVGALARPLEGEDWLENVAMVVCDGQAPRVWTDEVVSLFPLRVSELGGALRRTSALLHERLAAGLGDSYQARRITVTQPDGRETIELLALSEAEKAIIDPHLDTLLDKVMVGGVSRLAACRMLMARLVLEHEAAAEPAIQPPRGGEEQQYG